MLFASSLVQFDPFGGGGGGFGGGVDFEEIMRMMQDQQAAGRGQEDIFGSFFGVGENVNFYNLY